MTSTGAIIIGDRGNHRIRLVLPSGVVSTIAGNGVASFGGEGSEATSASLQFPLGVAVTATDAVVIADTNNNRIRLIAPSFAPSPAASSTSSPTPYCFPSLFRSLLRMDLVGTLVGTALSPGQPVSLPSEGACRQTCCDAPACDGYSFATATSPTSTAAPRAASSTSTSRSSSPRASPPAASTSRCCDCRAMLRRPCPP